MTFKTQIADDLKNVFFNADEFADLATFTPTTGAAKVVSVIIDKSVDLQPAGFSSAVVAQSITIEAILAELGKEPDRDETFTVSGTVYTVLSVVENDGYTVKVQVR
jgi:hypothetical protein